MTRDLSRRSFLSRSALLGCSLAASPLLTPVSLAAAPWDARLVVIILRGGMDGLDVLRPVGDPDWLGLRRNLSDGTLDTGGFFGLHPALAPLLPLWQQGEFGAVHAVATPYRDKRSHFDGQDILEAGTPGLTGVRDGWLNRMLQLLPAVETQTALALGHGELKVLSGPAPVADWSPDAELGLSPQAARLAGLVMAADPLFAASYSEALLLSEPVDLPPLDAGGELVQEAPGMGGGMTPAAGQEGGRRRAKAHVNIAAFAAERLRGDSRIASFSLNGWDTHDAQIRGMGRALGQLTDTILTLREGLGTDVWGRTTVIAMTEFGRTARENGTGGTDHGTGGAMLLAGGALRGGRVLGDWPGLSETALFNRRDLMPTRDVRAPAAWILRAVAGLDRSALERSVFPGLDMGDDPGLLR